MKPPHLHCGSLGELEKPVETVASNYGYGCHGMSYSSPVKPDVQGRLNINFQFAQIKQCATLNSNCPRKQVGKFHLNFGQFCFCNYCLKQ